MAHNYNNILTIIISACAMLEKNAIGQPEQLILISLINDSAERAAKLNQSLLAFSRRQPVSKQSRNLNLIVKNTQDFLVQIIGEDILLTTYLPDNPLMIMFDSGQIEQVLMNLAANARDAMPHGGILNIAVSQIENDGTVQELEGYRSGGYALITVSDSGEGINKAIQLRIFEPFFTTKVMGNGTGLGLSIVYGIIRQHGGAIHVISELGEGAAFRIYLPLCDQHTE
ncbi:MAG: ATP-binding protein [Desulfuromonadaceae bacterium]|nr:ATP-binding protein [Desulfuromonadaceae bacterium]